MQVFKPSLQLACLQITDAPWLITRILITNLLMFHTWPDFLLLFLKVNFGV